MRQELSDILSRNRPQLVDNIDPEHGILNELLAVNVLTRRQVKSIEVLGNPFKQVESLLDMLRRRPDEDFDKFCDILCKNNQEQIVKRFLKPQTETLSSPSEKLKESEESRLRPEPHTFNGVTLQRTTTEFYNEFKNQAYPMCNVRRGKCHIFNVINVRGMSRREGSEEDVKNLRQLFHQLHFSTETYTDLNGKEILDEVVKISRDPGLSHDQALVLIFLSHGHIVTSRTQRGYTAVEFIYGSDGEPVNTEHILEPLTNARCPSMQGKPKLVFFQACREYSVAVTPTDDDGYDELDALPVQLEKATASGASASSSSSASASASAPAPADVSGDVRVPISLKDFVIGYSSESGHPSHRDTDSGSWYIGGIVRVFSQSAHNMDLCAMLRKVNGQVTERRPLVTNKSSSASSSSSSSSVQVASHIDSLTKPYLFFFPGITTE